MCGLRAVSVMCKHDGAELSVEVVNLNGPGSVDTKANITRRSSILWLGVLDFLNIFIESLPSNSSRRLYNRSVAALLTNTCFFFFFQVP